MSAEPGPEAARTPTTTPTTTPVDPGAEEVTRLRAERDAAVAALEDRERRAARRGRVRRGVVGLLVVVFALLLPLTVTMTWAHRTVLNTDAYISTVTPIASDPAVTAAVSRQVTDQLYAALDPQAVIAQALPPQAAFLAAPIANGARGTVEDAVNKVLTSDQFQQLWVTANRTAHATLVTVLRGDSNVLQTTNGQVVLNLVPILNDALRNAQDFVSGVVGKPVTLPAISSDELPSAACAKISSALDRPLPDTCGQIALFPSKNLDTARQAVSWFDKAVVALLIATPLVAALALWTSRRRRRTLLQLTVGGALGLVAVRRALMWEQDQLVAAGRPENREARSAIVTGVLNGFFDLSAWILLALLVVAAVTLVTGPYRWAVGTRTRAAQAAATTGGLVQAGFHGKAVRPQDEPAVAWVRRHFDLLRVGGVVAAVLLLWVLDINVWWFLVILGLTALFEAWLAGLRPPSSITLPEAAPPAPRGPDDAEARAGEPTEAPRR